MTRTISLATVVLGAALLFAVPAWGQSQQDAFERTVAADATSTPSATVYTDAFERAAAAGQPDGLTASFPTDAFERMLPNRSGWVGSSSMGDHNTRVSPLEFSAPSSISTTGREIEWSQIGIGFGLGVLLALGLVLGARVARIRPLAH
jgi:hypothetical protein